MKPPSQKKKRKKRESRIAFRNLTRFKISYAPLRESGERALSVLKFSPQARLSVVFVGEDRMRALNRRWRKKDSPTTILSFSFLERNIWRLNGGQPLEVGEIVLCPAYVLGRKKSAQDLSRTLAILFVHGIVHLAGFTHERGQKAARRMEAQERKILKAGGV